jgi:prepilin-type processing-associated H-X9-DG protein
MADRHSKGANISCYDGHVEWWDNGTWKKWVNQPGIGRLWCDPLTPDGR